VKLLSIEKQYRLQSHVEGGTVCGKVSECSGGLRDRAEGINEGVHDSGSEHGSEQVESHDGVRVNRHVEKSSSQERQDVLDVVLVSSATKPTK